MIRGIHIAASGVLAGSRRQEVLGENMANAETPGYKAEQALLRGFPEMLLYRLEGARSTPIGETYQGAYVHEAVPVFSPGSIVQTERELDFALVGDARLPEVLRAEYEAQYNGEGKASPPVRLFFTVQDKDDPERRLFTRDGRFTIDPDGYLATQDGHRVLGFTMGGGGADAGDPVPIQVVRPSLQGTEQVRYTAQLSPDGRLSLLRPDGPSDHTGAFPPEATYQLALAAFVERRGEAPQNDPIRDVPNVYWLTKEGGNLWRFSEDGMQPVFVAPNGGAGMAIAPGQATPFDARFDLGAGLMQQAYETSNVDLIQEMTGAMANLRYYEANQRALLTIDQTLSRAVNEVGKV